MPRKIFEIDFREFLAVKATDVVKAKKELRKHVRDKIDSLRKRRLGGKTKKENERRIRELEQKHVCDAIADELEDTEEYIEIILGIDQLGDDVKDPNQINGPKPCSINDI